LGKNARIESIARGDLNMVSLTAQRTQYLTAGAK
jgi:cell division protein FtsL